MMFGLIAWYESGNFVAVFSEELSEGGFGGVGSWGVSLLGAINANETNEENYAVWMSLAILCSGAGNRNISGPSTLIVDSVWRGKSAAARASAIEISRWNIKELDFPFVSIVFSRAECLSMTTSCFRYKSSNELPLHDEINTKLRPNLRNSAINQSNKACLIYWSHFVRFFLFSRFSSLSSFDLFFCLCSIKTFCAFASSL